MPILRLETYIGSEIEMKQLILLTIILTIIPVYYVQGRRSKISEFADLIMDIHQLYKAKTVMLVHAIHYENIPEMEFIYQLSRILLQRNATFLSESIDEIKYSEEYYTGRIGRPLIVVFLTSRKAIQMFEAHAGNIDLVSPFWLILFFEIHEKPLYEYCHHPAGNPFQTTFNTELLVKCYEDEKIYEWYSLYQNETEVQQFATWDSINRLKLTSHLELYKRRTQIGGVCLRAAAIKNAKQYRGVSKLMYMMVKELSKALNFTLSYKIEEKGIGSWNYSTHEWSGIMHQIDNGEIEMSTSPMTMTSKRLEAVDFSQPLILARSVLFIKQPKTLNVKWIGHLQTFSAKVWYSILAFLLMTPIVLTLMKWKINQGNVTETQLLYDSYFSVWRIYCQQGVMELLTNSALRLAYFSIFLSSWIIVTLYSAYLTSYLTLPAPSLPFNDIEGFLADGTYKLITLRHAAEFDLFQSTEDPVLKKMKLLMKKPDDLPIFAKEAFEQVCNERVAFYTNEAKRQSQSSIPCSLVSIKTGRIDSVALTVNKHNQYLGVIKFHLQRFLDNGIMNRFKRIYLPKMEEWPESQHVSDAFQGVVPILIIISGGFGLALLILLFEKIYFWFTSKREKMYPYFD